MLQAQDSLLFSYETRFYDEKLDMSIESINRASNNLSNHLNDLDSLFSAGLVNNAGFMSIAPVLLKLKNEEAYQLLLKHAHKYKQKRYSNAMEVMSGELYDLEYAIRPYGSSILKGVAQYAYNSNYLYKELSEAEIDILRIVLYSFRNEYYEKLDCYTENKRGLKYKNLEKIVKGN